MKLKALLLGSAAALSVAGVAQAADLAVAEPVEYVKVCSVYGAGFFYVPGSDTCLKVTGYAQVTAGYASNASPRDFDMLTEAGIGVTGMWSGTAGEGSVVVKLKSVESDSAGSNTHAIVLDKGYGTFAGFLFGYADSTAKGIGALDTDNDGFYANNRTVTQFGYHATMGAIGVAIAAERGIQWGADWDQIPDIAAAVTFGAGGWNFKATGLIGDRISSSSVYGVSIGATGNIGAFGIQGSFAWSHNAPSFVGLANGAGNEGDAWSSTVSLKVPVGPASFGLTGTMADGDAQVGATYGAIGRLSFALGTNTTSWVELAGFRSPITGDWNTSVRARIKVALPGS